MKRHKRTHLLSYKATTDAGVSAYWPIDHAIAVRFKDESHIYIYTDDRTGREKVETMKKLAAQGAGLTTFINQHVRERYATKVSVRELPAWINA